jgi:hypothetical protein
MLSLAILFTETKCTKFSYTLRWSALNKKIEISKQSSVVHGPRSDGLRFFKLFILVTEFKVVFCAVAENLTQFVVAYAFVCFQKGDQRVDFFSRDEVEFAEHVYERYFTHETCSLGVVVLCYTLERHLLLYFVAFEDIFQHLQLEQGVPIVLLQLLFDERVLINSWFLSL